jgi:hypothetical protein
MLNTYSAVTTTEQVLTCRVAMPPDMGICIFKMFTGAYGGTLG